MGRKPNDLKGDALTYEVVAEGEPAKRKAGRPTTAAYNRGYKDGYSAAKSKYLAIVKILMEG